MIDLSPTRFAWIVLFFLLLLGCSSGKNGDPEGTPTLSAGSTLLPWEVTSEVTATPDVPQVALSLNDEDVAVSPLPLRAGFPFTITALVHNSSEIVAADVPLLLHMSAGQEEIGFTSFVQLLTVTIPASNSSFLKVLNKDLEYAGIEKTDDMGRVIHLHALRHSFASLLAREGVHPHVLQRLARHSKVDTTMRLYTHLLHGDDTRAIESLKQPKNAMKKNKRKRAAG